MSSHNLERNLTLDHHLDTDMATSNVPDLDLYAVAGTIKYKTLIFDMRRKVFILTSSTRLLFNPNGHRRAIRKAAICVKLEHDLDCAMIH